jgi:N-methylhydantoinase A/oxoprolinase/acetone carboxylase beta subunit
VQTCHQEGPQYDLPRLSAVYTDLEAQALAWLQSEQVPSEMQQLIYAADLRYAHQSFELTCPMPAGHVTQALVQELVAAFHLEHRRLYSYDLPNAPVELVNLRVTAIGLLPKLQPQMVSASALTLDGAVAGVRPVYFDQRGGFVDTPCYSRSRLAPGMTFEGPAIVDQDDATTVIFPHFHATVDPVGNLILAHQAA